MSHDMSTVTGTVSYVTGKFGNAIDTTSGYISTTDTLSSTIGTYEAWVKTTATATIVAVGNGNTSNWLGMSGGVAKSGITGAGDLSGTTSTLNDGAWHHLAVTFDGTNAKLWVDGANQDTKATTSGPNFSGQTAIGYFATVGFAWTGQIDEVRFSSTIRYTTTFTPSSSAFAGDANTTALYHLESSGADSAAAAGTVIPPNDTNIVYSPYTWSVGTSVAQTVNAGAYLRAVIAGSPSTIAATFDMSGVATPYPIITYRVDNAPEVTATLAASIPMTIPSDNTWSKHVVTIRVKAVTGSAARWTAPIAATVKFTGFTIGSSGAATSTARTKRLNLLCYGDSITEGILALTDGSPDTVRDDAGIGWAYLLGDLLGAEVGVVGFGGTGLTVAGSGSVPALTSTYNNLWAGQARSFSPTPDLILINEGTNDTGDVTSAATTVLNGLIAATSTSKIVVIQQWNGTTHKTQWQAAIAACTTPSRVTYLDTTGWWSSADSYDGTHPFGYVNIADLAPRIATSVGTLISGTVTPKRYINVGGVAKPVG